MRNVTKPLLIAFLVMLLGSTAARAAQEKIFVTVKATSIRRDRQFYAPTVASAVFRDPLLVLAREKDWIRVRAKGVEGWIHASATAATAVSVSAKEAAVGVSEGDVAFASKGFDAAVEREYAKGKSQANFAGVDRMEKLATSESALAEFKRAGNLRARGEKP